MKNSPLHISEDLPQQNELPFERDPFFCGRTPELAQIAEELLFYDDSHGGFDSPRIVILTGEAGIGKTSLALEFCYRYRLLWPAIFWSRGDVHLPGVEDRRAQAGDPGMWARRTNENGHQMSSTRQERLPPLLVIDHLQDVRQIEDWPVRFRGLCVLITSRLEEWPADLRAHLHTLARPGLADSVELIRKQAGWDERSSDRSLEPLAGLLEHHPFALRLAGLTLAGGRVGDVSSYVTDLEKQGSLFFDSRKNNPENPMPGWKMPICWTVFTEYWHRIVDLRGSISLKKVLAACAYCAPCLPLPVPILSSAVGCQPLVCEQALERLAALGFLVRSRNGIVILKAMGEYARYLDILEGWDMLEKMVAAWDEGVPDLLSGESDSFNSSLSAHLLYLACIGERNQVKRNGSLWYSLAHHVQERGEYVQAEQYYLHALDNDTAAFGDDHVRVAIIYYHLGNLAQIRADRQKARWNYERALGLFRGLLGAAHPLIEYTTSKIERLREIS